MDKQKISTRTVKNSSPYPPATWRLLVTPPLDGATNMAIDEAILHTLADGNGIPTLRFFQWEPPCLSLGYNQRWSDIDQTACQQRGYTWTRRPTGGKAILHTDEVTYSLIVPQDDPRIQGGVVSSYRALSFGLLRGLEKLGVQAQQATREKLQTQREVGKAGPVCFDTPSIYEITWQGKKLIGSAQLRRRHIVLQHGTLPLHGDLNRILEVLTLPTEAYAQQAELLPQRAITLESVVGQALSFEKVTMALIAGLADKLNLTLAEKPLTEKEQTLADELRARQYANDRWNKRV